LSKTLGGQGMLILTVLVCNLPGRKFGILEGKLHLSFCATTEPYLPELSRDLCILA
jgi:hypothetical protein